MPARDDFTVTIKIPIEITIRPVASVTVRRSPRNITDINKPITGTPSMAVDILVLDSHILAAFTATKQNAVAKGPINIRISIKEVDPSPS